MKAKIAFIATFTMLMIVAIPASAGTVSSYLRDPSDLNIHSCQTISVSGGVSDGVGSGNYAFLFYTNDINNPEFIGECKTVPATNYEASDSFTLPVGEYYNIRFAEFDGSCSVSNNRQWNAALESSINLVIDSESCGSPPPASISSSTQATSTEATISDMVFGQGIIITMLSLMVVGFMFNHLNNKKPIWQS